MTENCDAERRQRTRGVLLKVLTFNIRFVLDRWHERRALVEKIIKHYDVVGMQEVLNGGLLYGQDKMLTAIPGQAPVMANSDACFPVYLERLPFGIGLLCKLLLGNPISLLLRDLYAVFNAYCLEWILSHISASKLFHMPVIGDLFYLLMGSGWSFGNLTVARKTLRPQAYPALCIGGKYRIAQKTLINVDVKDEDNSSVTRKVWVINTHLSDTPGFPSPEVLHEKEQQRLKEFMYIVDWIASDANFAAEDTMIIMGDFNSPAHEPLHAVAESNGFRSAYKTKMGKEPSFTFHQSHECPTKDLGDEECYDFVYYKGPFISVQNVAIVGDKPCESDSTLYPSDHFGIGVNFTIH